MAAEQIPKAAGNQEERHPPLEHLLGRFLRSRGPVTLEQIRSRYALPEAQLRNALNELVHGGSVVQGKLTEGSEEPQWCDRRNLELLYRRAVVARREQANPAARSSYLNFLLLYHGIDAARRQTASAGLDSLLQRFRGMALPLGFFEREIIPSRLMCREGIAQTVSQAEGLLGDRVQEGRLVWRAEQVGSGSRSVRFFGRGEGRLFLSQEGFEESASHLSAGGRAVYDVLRTHGACFTRDLELAIGTSQARLFDSLSELVWGGLVTNDQWPAADQLAEFRFAPVAALERSATEVRESVPDWARRSRSPARRRRTRLRQRGPRRSFAAGRWSLVSSFAVLGRELTPEHSVRAQAMLLVERYGVLAKDFYRRESGLLPWGRLFRELKRLEWSGEIRRGYFVDGLSGVQFATADAAELLRRVVAGEEKVSGETVLLCAIDPALPFGGGTSFKLQTPQGEAVAFSRQPSNHLVLRGGLPVLYLEGYGSRIWPLQALAPEAMLSSLKMLYCFLQLPVHLRPRRKIEVEFWENQPITSSDVAGLFANLGFEAEGDRFVLWPSRLAAT